MTDFIPINESYWVEPGRLLAGEHPGHWEERVVRRRLCSLLDAGIRVFIDLSDEADAVHPYDGLLDKLCNERGIHAEYRNEPLAPDTLPDYADEVLAILRVIGRALDDGERVYVHCSDGVDRTGMVMGCWLVEQGLDPESALEELGRRFATMSKSRIYRSTPASALHAEWVENWFPALSVRLYRSEAS